MSIFSDYKCGALSEEEFEQECIAMNNRDRAEERELMMELYEEDEEESEK